MRNDIERKENEKEDVDESVGWKRTGHVTHQLTREFEQWGRIGV